MEYHLTIEGINYWDSTLDELQKHCVEWKNLVSEIDHSILEKHKNT